MKTKHVYDRPPSGKLCPLPWATLRLEPHNFPKQRLEPYDGPTLRLDLYNLPTKRLEPYAKPMLQLPYTAPGACTLCLDLYNPLHCGLSLPLHACCTWPTTTPLHSAWNPTPDPRCACTPAIYLNWACSAHTKPGSLRPPLRCA